MSANIPLLYNIIGVYRGIHYFLIFALKHGLWVLVRTASINDAVLTCTNKLCFEQKDEKNLLNISTENCYFYSYINSQYKCIRHVIVMF